MQSKTVKDFYAMNIPPNGWVGCEGKPGVWPGAFTTRIHTAPDYLFKIDQQIALMASGAQTEEVRDAYVFALRRLRQGVINAIGYNYYNPNETCEAVEVQDE